MNQVKDIEHFVAKYHCAANRIKVDGFKVCVETTTCIISIHNDRYSIYGTKYFHPFEYMITGSRAICGIWEEDLARQYHLTDQSILAFKYGSNPYEKKSTDMTYDEKLMFDLSRFMGSIYSSRATFRPFSKAFPEASTGLDHLFTIPKHLSK